MAKQTKNNKKLQNKKRQIISMTIAFVLIPVTLWIIYTLIKWLTDNTNINNLNPNSFVNVLTKTSTLVFGIGCGVVIAIAFILWYLLRKYEYEPKKSKIFGSSNWLTKYEFYSNFKSHDINTEHEWGWVLTTKYKTKKIPFKQKTKINNLEQKEIQFYTNQKMHALVIGSTGSGKTQNIILPSIIYNLSSKERPSIIITDPKGFIEKEINHLIKHYNYQKYVFDFNNFDGNCWNPLIEIQKNWNYGQYDDAELKIDRLVNILTSRIKSHNDPIWHLSANSFITVLIIRLLIEGQDNKKIISFNDLIDKFSNTTSQISNWILEKYSSNKFLRRSASLILEQKEPKFLETVKKTAEVALKPLRNNKFSKMSNNNDFDVSNLVNGGVIIFLKTHITDSTYWFLNQLFISLLLNKLIILKSHKQNKPILFCLDEFGNIPTIPNFSNILSTAREYNIWFNLVIQSYDQLNQYKHYKNLIANTHLKYYLHTNNLETAKTISSEYGNKTIHASNYKNDKIVSSHKIGRPLIDYYDLMKLSKNTIIIKIDILNPLKTSTLPFYEFVNHLNYN